VIYAAARAFGAAHAEALERTVLMAQGGEFAFVLYAAAMAAGLISPEENAVLTAIIVLSMILTPLAVLLHDRTRRPAAPSADGLDVPDGQTGTVLLIGFGRFGQIVSQPLLSEGCAVTIIDTDTEMIRVAETMGFKVYYGDGRRLDILRAAGAATARVVVVATDGAETTTRIAHLVRHEFPNAAVLARAWDRAHALELIREGVDGQVRETFHSALALGSEALELLGVDADTIAQAMDEVRRRDAERLALQSTGDIYAGKGLLIGNAEHVAGRTAPPTAAGVSPAPTAPAAGSAP
jgi:voltage-gated potassium channel Kch